MTPTTTGEARDLLAQTCGGMALHRIRQDAEEGFPRGPVVYAAEILESWDAPDADAPDIARLGAALLLVCIDEHNRVVRT